MNDIEKRIAQLREDAIEEGERINDNSLVDFTNFTELIDDCIAESLIISLTPDNEIYISYQVENDRYSFCFKGNGNISFVKIKTKSK